MSYLTLEVVAQSRIRAGKPVSSLGFWTGLPGLIKSFAEPGEEVHLHYESARQVAEAVVEFAFARFRRTGSARRWVGTLLYSLAERINQELQEKFCHMFQSETAIDYACDHDRVLREHFPQVTRSHREEVLPPELEEVFEPRQLDLDEPEGDETETARTLSERERRELLWQHRNLGHPQPTELARALRHAGARREAIRFVFKKMRCPTCEARPLPLPPRPGMLPRCLRLNQCIGVDLVDLEVRDGTSAKALNVVCCGTSLKIVQTSCNRYTVHAVVSEFKAVWVKHYCWPEILVHDQGPEFMGSAFQNPAGAAGVLTTPIDSQSPWLNGKTERAGRFFKHQLWDMDE